MDCPKFHYLQFYASHCFTWHREINFWIYKYQSFLISQIPENFPLYSSGTLHTVYRARRTRDDKGPAETARTATPLSEPTRSPQENLRLNKLYFIFKK